MIGAAGAPPIIRTASGADWPIAFPGFDIPLPRHHARLQEPGINPLPVRERRLACLHSSPPMARTGIRGHRRPVRHTELPVATRRVVEIARTLVRCVILCIRLRIRAYILRRLPFDQGPRGEGWAGDSSPEAAGGPSAGSVWTRASTRPRRLRRTIAGNPNPKRSRMRGILGETDQKHHF